MFDRNKKEIYSITVDDIDRQIILQALSDLKDKQKSLNKKNHNLHSGYIKY